MLSVLIPTYNYNVYPLVKALHEQCSTAGITFEIISVDDGSASAVNTENQKINTLANCRFTAMLYNKGRSATRNLLAKEAKYNWLLFLDADTMPVDYSLIKRYLAHADEQEKVIYGGIRYQEHKPEKDKLLRWVYGNSREALPAAEREKMPYLRLLTLNFLIHKKVFNKVCFNEAIPNLRHEDTLFSYELMKSGIEIKHIENNVYHLGLDDSRAFIKKSEEAMVGLQHLLNGKLLAPDYVGIGKLYLKLRNNGLCPFVAFLFKIMKNLMLKNLLGPNPSLKIFDLYRIGYICCINK